MEIIMIVRTLIIINVIVIVFVPIVEKMTMKIVLANGVLVESVINNEYPQSNILHDKPTLYR